MIRTMRGLASAICIGGAGDSLYIKMLSTTTSSQRLGCIWFQTVEQRLSTCKSTYVSGKRVLSLVQSSPDPDLECHEYDAPAHSRRGVRPPRVGDAASTSSGAPPPSLIQKSRPFSYMYSHVTLPARPLRAFPCMGPVSRRGPPRALRAIHSLGGGD